MRTYTEQELIAFGNAMLSKPNDENRQSGVTDADVANFNEKLEKIATVIELAEMAANALISLGDLLKGPLPNFKVKEGQVQSGACSSLLTKKELLINYALSQKQKAGSATDRNQWYELIKRL